MQLRTEVRQEPQRLGDILPWSHMVHAPGPSAVGARPTSPTILQNKDGALMATLRYRGPDVTMLDYTEWCLYLEGWNKLIRRLGSGWALWPDEWHEEATDYPQSVWQHAAGYFLDSVRKTVFESGQLFQVEQFLTATWLPPSTKQQFMFDTLFVKRAQQRPQREDARHLDQYIRALETFGDALTHLLPVCEWLTPKETLTYLRRCVSWDRHTVAMPERPEDLDLRLGTSRFEHGFTPRLAGRYLRPISVMHWPLTLGMTIPSTLQQLHIPYRYTARYLCLDATKAKSILNGMRRRWEVQVLPVSTHVMDAWNGTKTNWEDPDAQVNEEAREHAYALKRAVQAISSEDIAYGYCSPTILLWADTPQELAQRERAVIKLLQGDEFILEPETHNASKAWASMIPGDAYSNVRNPMHSTRLWGFMMPHGAVWSGERWDHHFKGPPLITASSNGQPYWFTLHHQYGGSIEGGSAMIVGPTRSGKSGLLGLIGVQALRYDGMQIFAWDQYYSLYCATLMAGGAHYDIGVSHDEGFQPLGDVDTETARRWRQAWLEGLFLAEGEPTTVSDRQAIWDALTHLATQPRDARTMSLFTRYLQVHRLKQALEPYCTGGRFACFDADHDSFQLGSHWTTFEMGAMLTLPPHVVALAMEYVFHEIEQCFTGRPTLLLLDEGWQFMKHKVFWPKMLLYLKAKAKQNVAMILSTQEVADARNTELWQALLGSIRTWIYLPNKQAMNSDVLPQYEACGVTAAEAQILAMGTDYQDYLVKAGRQARMLQCRLDPLQRCFVAASRQDEIAALRTLAQTPSDESLQARWLRFNQFEEAATMYEELIAELQEVAV